MRLLTWRFILPITIVSFGIFTKWWYVLPVDAPDTMMIGFPLAFAGDCWFTSMSLQIFILEFVVDFLIYFLFWFLITMLINRYLIRIKIARILTGILWILSAIIFSVAVWIASYPEQYFKMKRDWDMKVLVTGYKFTWTHQDRPDFKKFE
jgi:ABC-type transport system involved in multi-copper enzyme maturation permease subunit